MRPQHPQPPLDPPACPSPGSPPRLATGSTPRWLARWFRLFTGFSHAGSRICLVGLTATTLAASLDRRVGPNVPCGPDPTPLPTGFRAQAEPHLARHPVNPDVLLATFQDGRFTNGGAVSCGYAVSRDGGLSWTRALIPQAAKIDGGVADRATDPVAAFSPDGATWYLNTLGISGADLEIGILQLSRSTNGGVSFLPPVEIYRSPNGSVFPDKNWLAVNPFPGTPTYRRLVVTFTRFEGASAPIAATHSDDDGLTWSEPVFVTGPNQQCQGSQPVFLPDGRLAVLYWDFRPSPPTGEAIRMVISPDGGTTFGQPMPVVSGIRSYDHPVTRDGTFLPSAAVDPVTGTLWVAWQAQVSGIPRILVARSLNAGATWSAPKVVSDNPPSKPVFNATLAVSPNGQTVLVAFWDTRAGVNEFQLDTWVAASTDGGLTWQPNLRVTSESTDARRAPLTSRGYMLGDYFGLVAPTDALSPGVVLTIDTREGEPQPLSARFGVGPGLTFDNWRAARFSRQDLADPALGGEQGDGDGDQLGLFAEYAFDRDPRAPDSVRLQLEPQSDGHWLIRYPFNAAATDVQVGLEISDQLTEWRALPGSTATGAGPTATVPLNADGSGSLYRATATRR
jgi:hypothetical protein